MSCQNKKVPIGGEEARSLAYLLKQENLDDKKGNVIAAAQDIFVISDEEAKAFSQKIGSGVSQMTLSVQLCSSASKRTLQSLISQEPYLKDFFRQYGSIDRHTDDDIRTLIRIAKSVQAPFKSPSTTKQDLDRFMKMLRRSAENKMLHDVGKILLGLQMRQQIDYSDATSETAKQRAIELNDATLNIATYLSLADYEATLTQKVPSRDWIKLPANVRETLKTKELLLEGKIYAYYEHDTQNMKQHGGGTAIAGYLWTLNAIVFSPAAMQALDSEHWLLFSHSALHECAHVAQDLNEKPLEVNRMEAEAWLTTFFYIIAKGEGDQIGKHIPEMAVLNDPKAYDPTLNKLVPIFGRERVESLKRRFLQNDLIAETAGQVRGILTAIDRDEESTYDIDKIARCYADTVAFKHIRAYVDADWTETLVMSLKPGHKAELSWTAIGSQKPYVRREKVSLPRDINKCERMVRESLVAMRSMQGRYDNFDLSTKRGIAGAHSEIKARAYMVWMMRGALDPNVDLIAFYQDFLFPTMQIPYVSTVVFDGIR